jgi:DNA anti-recombination protein RmuC
MEGFYIVIGLVVLIGMVLFFFMDHRWRKALEEVRKDQASQPMWALMQQQMEQLRGQTKEGLDKNISQLIDSQNVINKNLSDIMDRVNKSLQNSSGDINRRLDNAAKVIGDVQRNIGELSTASKQIFEVGKNIASLQEILQPPKLRGGIGEQFLGELLSQILPRNFSPFNTSSPVGRGLMP